MPVSNDFLSVQKTTELIADLKKTVSEFNKREMALSQGLRITGGKYRTELEEALERQDKKLEADLETAEENYKTRRGQLEDKYKNREAKINKAFLTSKQHGRELVHAREGQGRYDLQKHRMIEGRRRDEAMGEARQEYGEMAGFLEDAHERLRGQESLAQNAFKGYRIFGKNLAAARREQDGEDLLDNGEVPVEEIQKLVHEGNLELDRFRQLAAPKFFKAMPIFLLITILVVGHVAFLPLIHFYGWNPVYYGVIGTSLVWMVLMVGFFYLVGKKRGTPIAENIAKTLGRSRKVLDASLAKIQGEYEAKTTEIEGGYESKLNELKQGYAVAVKEAEQLKETYPEKIEAQKTRLLEKNQTQSGSVLSNFDAEHQTNLQRIKSDSANEKARLEQECTTNLANLDTDLANKWLQAEEDWKNRVTPIYEALQKAQGASEQLFAPWTPENCAAWQVPDDFPNVAKLGQVSINVSEMADGLPEDPRFQLPGPNEFTAPLNLAIPDQGAYLVETKNSGREEAIANLNSVMLRLLATTPPGRISFTVLDPVGLGENFAGLMHIADYEESVIHSRIWTQTDQFEARLAELNEHMEKVIQMYLRNEYESITEYNLEAGNIAEKYRFLVVADFPNGFSDVAARRLMSIAQSGPRCGVYTLIHWDLRQKVMPHDFVPDELRSRSILVNSTSEGFILPDLNGSGIDLSLESPPNQELGIEFVHRIGKASVDSTRVEVPFETIAPSPEEFWSIDTTKELQVPIGRTGATKLQYLAIGKGTRQHALIAGKTGSGKSTLFHVMITNLSLWCSPDMVEFYLIDFKKGVEFKSYATNKLPHARVIAIESDREFGLSVLQKLDEELRRRGDLFRQLGAQDVAGYKAAGGTEAMPRSLLMIDEFQEFFVEDDRIAQNAAVLMDRIVRQGRAFGIHVILGSQTLGGAFTLARATLGQMVIRVALQCNEADSYLILDDSNPAARLLARPGEGIYNDNAGAIEGNSPFQVVWLDEAVRDEKLAGVREAVAQSGKSYPAAVVFEGNAPAEIRENNVLFDLLNAPQLVPARGGVRAWLGAPNSIKGPTEATFQRQSGNNLLIIGQRDEAALAIMAVSMISIAAQHPKESAKFVLIDGTAPDTPEREFLHSVANSIPHEVTLVHNAQIDDAMTALDQDMAARAGDDSNTAPVTFVLVHGLQKYKKLRHEDDFGFSLSDEPVAKAPGAVFNDLMTEGSSVGIHIVAVCDTYNNLTRALSRKALTEFEMRVVFQMSANDSSALIDSPKAGNLGLNRALFYNEQEGYLETFRPYALPDSEWISEAAGHLARLCG